MPGSGARSPGTRELRRYLRDLAALTALPTVWNRQSRRQVAEGAAEVLAAVLRLDAAYVRLQGGAGERAIEVTHLGEESGIAIARAEIDRALGIWLRAESFDPSVLRLPRS